MAVVREIEEEIGIKLVIEKEDKNINAMKIGKFLKNFYCYKTKKGKLYLTVQVFLWLDKNINLNITINE